MPAAGLAFDHIDKTAALTAQSSKHHLLLNLNHDQEMAIAKSIFINPPTLTELSLCAFLSKQRLFP